MLRIQWKGLIGLALVLIILCAAVYSGMLQGKKQQNEIGPWRKIPNAPVAQPTGRMAKALVGNKLVIWGGVDARGACADGAIYDIGK